ncbi:MAG: BrnA antitoxin family protein [Steroidobacteraceae bacterium]
MKRKSSSPRSKTNFRRLKTLKSEDVLLTEEHPEADLKHIVGGIVRRGLKVAPPKASISLRVDADVLEWFRASGSGYQSRMNAVLRAFKEAAR